MTALEVDEDVKVLPVPGLAWRFFAACKDAPVELNFVPPDDPDAKVTDEVIDVEPYFPTEEQLEYCNACPVRPECLGYALANPDMSGTWGATSSYQRRQLRRPRSRRSCPGCGCTDIVIDGPNEMCVGCALSWEAV